MENKIQEDLRTRINILVKKNSSYKIIRVGFNPKIIV